MSEETLTYDPVESIRDYKFGRSALNWKRVYHIFTSRRREKSDYIYNYFFFNITSNIYFILLREVKSCRRICIILLISYNDSFPEDTMLESSEVVRHRQYLFENSNCHLFIIEQYHRVDTYFESARVTDKVRLLIILCCLPFSTPLRLPSSLRSVSNVPKLKSLDNSLTKMIE